jgi:hypothetical protein
VIHRVQLAIGIAMAIALGCAFVFLTFLRGDPFVIRYVRTADREVIEITHPRHPQPMRIIFAAAGPPLDQTITIDHHTDTPPFGTMDFIDITLMPGRVRMTNQGVPVDIMETVTIGSLGEHRWGTTSEIDLRPSRVRASSDRIIAPTPSP